MKVYVVTEGPADVALFERVIKGVVKDGPVFVAAGAKSAVISMAQSLMVSRHAPVAVVLDADTSDPDLVLEQKGIYSDILRAYSQGVPFRVFLAVPSVEHLLFEQPGLLERELAIHISARDMGEAMVRPKQTLDRLTKRSSFKSRDGFLANLSDQAARELAQLPLMDALIRFLRSPARPEAANLRPASNWA